MFDGGLNDRQISILRSVLAPYAEKIERVGVFGSRATKLYRPNSDIDLVLYGPVDQKTVDRLWTDFDASPLALKVDINAYDLIAYQPLKAHIDAVMQPLFNKADLLHMPLNPAGE